MSGSMAEFWLAWSSVAAVPLGRALLGLPFHFWSVVMFMVGCAVGSFLNVCVHRLPREESVVWPGSHCPACNHEIPWYLNIPLFSWLQLKGRCRFCGARISSRYLIVELLTGLLFGGCWLKYGMISVAVALVYCVFVGLLVAATFIDVEHFIIPDVITLGGLAAGVISSFLVPELQMASSSALGLKRCAVGAGLGAGIIYAFLRVGKLLFGRQRFELPAGSRVVFLETELVLPNQRLPYGEMFYRKRDAIELHAELVEMPDRCYRDVPVRLTQEKLEVGGDQFAVESVPCLEVVTGRVAVPREAMGMGDVKFMAMVGAFVGWRGVLFTLLGSAMLGSLVGIVLIALRRREWSSRIPYGPYIALAAIVWLFAGDMILRWYAGR